jgi:hypothetical protein
MLGSMIPLTDCTDFHKEPAFVVRTVAFPAAATQVVADAHDTDQMRSMPLGTDCATHVLPPFVVPKATPSGTFGFVPALPTISQRLGVEHEIPKKASLCGTCCAAQDFPASVVRQTAG